jgi:hypothetical protein
MDTTPTLTTGDRAWLDLFETALNTVDVWGPSYEFGVGSADADLPEDPDLEPDSYDEICSRHNVEIPTVVLGLILEMVLRLLDPAEASTRIEERTLSVLPPAIAARVREVLPPISR